MSIKVFVIPNRQRQEIMPRKLSSPNVGSTFSTDQPKLTW